MRWFSRRDGVPAQVRTVLELGRGERIMGAARDTRSGDHVVATTYDVALVSAGAGGAEAAGSGGVGDSGGAQVRLRRPWHEVSAGAWEPLTQTISVTWVDGGRAAQWTLAESADQGAAFATAFYERVAESVLIDAPVEIEGRSLGRVAIRRDMRTGDLLRQVTWSRAARHDDEHARAYAQVLLDDLAEQVGLT